MNLSKNISPLWAAIPVAGLALAIGIAFSKGKYVHEEFHVLPSASNGTLNLKMQQRPLKILRLVRQVQLIQILQQHLYGLPHITLKLMKLVVL